MKLTSSPLNVLGGGCPENAVTCLMESFSLCKNSKNSIEYKKLKFPILQLEILLEKSCKLESGHYERAKKVGR